MREEWRPIPGWEGFYEVSDLGRVRGIERVSSGRRQKSRVLKPTGPVGNTKYLFVRLRRKGKTDYKPVHHFVLVAFAGPRPLGKEACHNDGDPTNNCATNLRWDTHTANMQDQVRHGTRRLPPVKARRTATCHPDRKHLARGLCSACYQRAMARKRTAT